MSFGDHLEELRRRVFAAIFGLLPILFVSLLFASDLLVFVLQPVYHALAAAGQPRVLQSLGPAEAFMAAMKVAFIVSIAVGGPWIVYQLWKFVSPGLYIHERRFAYVLAPLSVVMTAAGMVFLYTIMLPLFMAFLIHFGAGIPGPATTTAPLPTGVTLTRVVILPGDPSAPTVGDEWINTDMQQRRICVGVDPKTAAPKIVGIPLVPSGGVSQSYSIRAYVDMFTTLALAFVVAFQTPVVVLLLGWVGLVTPAGLAKVRRYAILGSFVAGAIISPSPDPVSMIIAGAPLYGLYELGGFLLRVLPARRVGGKKPVDGDEPNDDHPHDAPTTDTGDADPHRHDAGGP